MRLSRDAKFIRYFLNYFVQNVETDTPYGYDPGVMIQIVPEAGKSKWSHIDDLDSFFTKVYEYHQKHGFTVMMLQELLELIQFIFMIMFTVFLIECVDYPLLFKEQSHETNIFLFWI